MQAFAAAVVVTWLVFAGTLALADRPVAAVSVTVHNQVLHEVDARLFGQFMERPSWGGEIGPEGSLVPGTHQLHPEAKRLIRQMQIPIVRFPGGTDVDYIDWWDMIDNVPGRAGQRPISIGHTGNQVTNHFGYDEFLRLCEELAMEPILVVNFRDGLLGKDGLAHAAQHAADLVAYCNASNSAALRQPQSVWPRLRQQNGHVKSYSVKYVQIGNETWAFSRDVSEDRYLEAVQAYVEAIRAVDPSVQFIADGQPVTLAARLARELRGRIAYLAVHHYQPWQISEVRGADGPADATALSARDIWYAWVSTPQIDSAGQSVLDRTELQQARRLGYKVAMTEWNWNGRWGQNLRGRVALDSLYAKGLGAAGMLHAIMRQGDVVKIATQSMLIGDGWDIHAIQSDRQGRAPPVMLPSGQVTMLYSQRHGSKRLKVDLADVPRYEQPHRMAGIGPSHGVACLDLLATRNDTTLFLHAINRHFDAALRAQIDLSAIPQRPLAKGKLHLLEGRLNDSPKAGEDLAVAQIRVEDLSVSGPCFRVQLPARSVAVVEVPLQPEISRDP